MRFRGSANEFVKWTRDELEDGSPITLRLGASLTIGETLVPAWLGQLRQSFPAAALDLRVLNSKEVVAAVRHGHLDLGLIETPHVPADLQHRQLGTDHLIVVVAPTHPWANRRDPVSLRELAATPLVVREKGSGTRQGLEDRLRDVKGVPPFQVLESNMAVRIATISGAAPAVLSELAVREQLKNGSLVAVPIEHPLPRPLTAVWQGPRTVSPALSLFLRIAANSLVPK